ncbi:HNH endonuclease [Providencia sp. PROV148]|uniref:HNH endonuclease n=1 Tax=Providencia sp. PROV148 TaxID=2949858 RepID=UPI00234A65AE|nr:HNH endonuclease [Providencia sp. PROV148]
MRPVKKGLSPINGDFSKYEDAKQDLVSRLGRYCSYCERKIATLLAVEHIEPKKGAHGQPHLEKRWSNFLLACTNCNSCKGDKAVDLSQTLFPDRDNTFYAYVYEADGNIALASHLSFTQKRMAQNTLALVGLDKPLQVYLDSNGEQVALDRVGQRMEMFGIARAALSLLQLQPENQVLMTSITSNAIANGFFSIWMTVFKDYPEMTLKFIQAFKGTEGSGCFNMMTCTVCCPSPNPDGLSHGGKV